MVWVVSPTSGALIYILSYVLFGTGMTLLIIGSSMLKGITMPDASESFQKIGGCVIQEANHQSTTQTAVGLGSISDAKLKTAAYVCVDEHWYVFSTPDGGRYNSKTEQIVRDQTQCELSDKEMKESEVDYRVGNVVDCWGLTDLGKKSSTDPYFCGNDECYKIFNPEPEYEEFAGYHHNYYDLLDHPRGYALEGVTQVDSGFLTCFLGILLFYIRFWYIKQENDIIWKIDHPAPTPAKPESSGPPAPLPASPAPAGPPPPGPPPSGP